MVQGASLSTLMISSQAHAGHLIDTLASHAPDLTPQQWERLRGILNDTSSGKHTSHAHQHKTMRVDSTPHRHGARGTNYTLCIGAGGLTNVKQRIWHCVQQANRTGRALLPPWAQDEPVRRGRPTIQPLSLVFDRVAWHSTLKSLGVRSVSSLGRLDLSLLNATSVYNLHKAEVLRECAQLGCTVDFEVGNLDKGVYVIPRAPHLPESFVC